MFVITARIPKRKLLAGAITALCCCLAAGAILLAAMGRRISPALAEVSGLRGEDERAAYLAELGWEISGEPTVDELLIPRSFDESYGSYLALQTAQGFDLNRWRGKAVKRYTYIISNWPEEGREMRIALLLRRDTVIGGHIQSADGSVVLPLTGEESKSVPAG